MQLWIRVMMSSTVICITTWASGRHAASSGYDTQGTDRKSALHHSLWRTSFSGVTIMWALTTAPLSKPLSYLLKVINAMCFLTSIHSCFTLTRTQQWENNVTVCVITCAQGALLIQLTLRGRGCFSMAQLQPRACTAASRVPPPSSCNRAAYTHSYHNEEMRQHQ